MGMGRGMGSGMKPMTPPPRGSLPSVPPQQQMTPEQELQMLENQAEAIKQQLDQLVDRIEDVEKE